MLSAGRPVGAAEWPPKTPLPTGDQLWRPTVMYMNSVKIVAVVLSHVCYAH